MSLIADNVRVAIDGAAYSAPYTAALPADTLSAGLLVAWPAGWAGLGYLSEDGLTEGSGQETSEIKAWQKGVVIRKVISSQEKTFGLTLIQSEFKVLDLFYSKPTWSGNGTATAFKMLYKGAKSDIRRFGFDVLDGTKHQRIIVPRGEITAREDIEYGTDNAVGYPFTLTAYPDIDETIMIKMSADAAWGYS